jgi:hypothetical protein
VCVFVKVVSRDFREQFSKYYFCLNLYKNLIQFLYIIPCTQDDIYSDFYRQCFRHINICVTNRPDLTGEASDSFFFEFALAK